jgi:hypothetical protein
VTTVAPDVFFEETFLFFAKLLATVQAVTSWNGEGLFSKYCKENLEEKILAY